METQLLPIIALITVTASSNAFAANEAYVTDGYGAIVKDNYGSCVRTSKWTAETADASCEQATQTAPKAESSTSEKVAAPAPTLLAPVKEDIDGSKQNAYVIDSSNRIVRDGYGYCVRTIHWSKETAIPKCEGWAEPKAPEVVKPAPVLVPKPAPVVTKVKDDAPVAFRGFFDTNKSLLKDEAKTKLNDYSEYMERNTNTSVKVSGHTDSTGTEAYNQGLSERRANAVKTYLESKGIDGQRIQTEGFGETQPLATNRTKEGRAENRRVELEIIK